jgi:Domain of unknown function (DUF3883)
MATKSKNKGHRIVDAAMKALNILGGKASVKEIHSVIKRHGFYRFNTPVEIHVLDQTIKRHASNSRRSDASRYEKFFEYLDASWGEGPKVSFSSVNTDTNLTESDQVKGGLHDGIDLVVNPHRRFSGFRSSFKERRAIELHAMTLAYRWLRDNGFSDIIDCSAKCPFDYQARAKGRLWKIEVKGTTSTRVDAFLMTSNEVALHEAERGATVLVVVYGIQLSYKKSAFSVFGGQVSAEVGWDISACSLEPTSYRVSRR